jgi:hypothetical protein
MSASQVAETQDHERIWLEPAPGDPTTGRQWCQDDVWTAMAADYDGALPTEYVRADLAAAHSDAAALAMRAAAVKMVESHQLAAKRCSEESDLIHRIRADFLSRSFALKTAGEDLSTLPLPPGGRVLAAMLAAERDRTLEEAAAMVEAEGTCRHVDHVQGFCSCADKAAAIRKLAVGSR